MTVIILTLSLLGSACALWLLRQPDGRSRYAPAFFVPLLVAPLVLLAAALAGAAAFGLLWVAAANLALAPVFASELLHAGVGGPALLLDGEDA